jgi:hypothetical protein
VNVTRYRADGSRLLAVDAEQYVPDRTAFAARVCDGQSGVAPSRPDAQAGAVREQPAITGGTGTGQPAAADRSDGPGPAPAGGGDPTAAVRGADAVVFLAMEPSFSPPRVVTTVVRPDGERTAFCPDAARCAARWVAERTDAARVMVDTQAGTRAARVHEDGQVTVETGDSADGAASDPPTARGPVEREFAVDLDIEGWP